MEVAWITVDYERISGLTSFFLYVNAFFDDDCITGFLGMLGGVSSSCHA